MKKIIIILMACLTMVLFFACSEKEILTPNPTTTQVLEEERDTKPAITFTEEANLRGTCDAVIDGCANATNNGNCVLFARCKVPSLPFGLTTYAQKKAIINTTIATAGSVAIINVGNTTGHVAYVKSVSGITIYLRESNWCGTKVTDRSGTATLLKIVGYFKP
ncbi:MAG: hypothetical protein RLZZ292_3700 [Bacteroidota bacterium]|jgi:hypothetical protein